MFGLVCKKKFLLKCSFSFNRFECGWFGQAFQLLPLQRAIPSYTEDTSSKGNIASTPTDGFRDQFRLYKFCLRLLYATSTACAAYFIQKHCRKFLSSNFAYAFDCCTKILKLANMFQIHGYDNSHTIEIILKWLRESWLWT